MIKEENSKKEVEKQEEVEFKSLKAKGIIFAVLIFIIILAIIMTLSHLLNPEKAKVDKESICKELCLEKNLTFYGTETTGECFCSQENNMIVTAGIITDNGTVIKPEPLIINNSEGQVTCTINRTTQKIICENINKTGEVKRK